MEFIQARWHREGRQGKAIRLFVIHDAEAPEKSTTAEAVARYFSTVERKASAHYCTDNNSSVQCVRDADTAFGAAGANNDGLHFEQAGYARQTRAEWLDPYGLAQFEQMGVLLRAKSREHDVPLRWLTVDEVRDGKTRGLCTHADVTAAFPNVSTGHTDPGPNFPKDVALATWLGVDPTPPEDPDMDADDKARAAHIEQMLEQMPSNGLSTWGADENNINDYRALSDGSVVQIVNGQKVRDFHTKAVPFSEHGPQARPSKAMGPGTRQDFTVELADGKSTVRHFTYAPDREGFPGEGTLAAEGRHLVKDGDGWHYVDIAT